MNYFVVLYDVLSCPPPSEDILRAISCLALTAKDKLYS